MIMQLRFIERQVYVKGCDGIGHVQKVKILQQRHPIMKRSTTGVISNTPFISGYTDWIDVPLEIEEAKGDE